MSNSLAGLADVDKEQGQVGEARAGLERAIVVLKDYQAKHKDDRWISFHCERLERRLQKWMEPTAPPMPAL